MVSNTTSSKNKNYNYSSCSSKNSFSENSNNINLTRQNLSYQQNLPSQQFTTRQISIKNSAFHSNDKFCNNCLMCIEACPNNLLPNYLYHSANKKAYQLAEELNISLCNECYKCSSICSANLPLCENISKLKKEIFQENCNNQNNIYTQISNNNQTSNQFSRCKNNITNDHRNFRLENNLSNNILATSKETSHQTFKTTCSSSSSHYNNKQLALLAINIILFTLSVGKYGYKIVYLYTVVLLTIFSVCGIFESKIFERQKLLFIVNWAFIFLLINTPSINFTQAITSTLFSYFFGFYFFGGLQCSFISTVVFSKIFILISYPTSSNYFVKPYSNYWYGFRNIGSFIAVNPESLYQNEVIQNLSLNDLLFGNLPTVLGESLPLALLLSFFLLSALNYLDIRFTFSSLLSTTIFLYIVHYLYPEIPAFKPLVHVLLGGNLLVITQVLALEPYSINRTIQGRYISGILYGILTILLRSFYSFAHGAYYSYFIISILVPVIDYFCINLVSQRMSNYNKQI